MQTRLSYYASSKRARAILGQPRSTIDLRETILGGGILLVSTAQGVVGRDVAALVGASLLNLVDAVIREQGGLALSKRRGALVVVDEMQSMPGVDYESMLSELGKFGASFILATQSLAKLEDLSRTMRDTLLANVGCLAVFQVAGNDARQLVWELGKDRVSEDDIVSLDVHHCYVRATVGKERMPAFSMMVQETGGWRPRPLPTASEPPPPPTRSPLNGLSGLMEGEADGNEKVSAYRRLLAEMQQADGGDPQNGKHSPPDKPDRRRLRTRRGDDPGGVHRPRGQRGGRRMRPSPLERELLRRLAEMPFLDRLELAAATGWSPGRRLPGRGPAGAETGCIAYYSPRHRNCLP